MSHPYRTAPEPPPQPGTPVEEYIVDVLLIVVGAMPVLGALLDGSTLGVAATIGLVLAGLGALDLLRRLARNLRR